MTRFAVKFAELYEPLFMGGNLGTKLDPRGRTGLRLEYDTELRALLVHYQGSVSLVFSNLSSAQPFNPADVGVEQNSPQRTIPEEPRVRETRPIIQPTAPPARTPPMAPYVPPMRSAQVSHPVHDAVHGPFKPTHAPKYLPHTGMEIQRAAALAVSGEVRPGNPAPTTADLIAAGKIPAPAPAADSSPTPTQPPRRRGRPAKVEPS